MLPCFSPDGKIIAAIDFSSAGKYQLQFIDAKNGNIIKKFLTQRTGSCYNRILPVMENI